MKRRFGKVSEDHGEKIHIITEDIACAAFNFGHRDTFCGLHGDVLEDKVSDELNCLKCIKSATKEALSKIKDKVKV